MFYSKSEKFSFLTMSQVKIDHILPKRKNATTNFFECSMISKKLPEN